MKKNLRKFAVDSVNLTFVVSLVLHFWGRDNDEDKFEVIHSGQCQPDLCCIIGFSFSHGVFNRFVLQTRKNHGLFGKGLILGQMTKFYAGFVQKDLQMTK